jgi:hypothetical protein
MHSRILEILYISHDPEKSDLWIRDHKNKVFREENIRNSLKTIGINTIEHLYNLGNDIVHTNYPGLRDLEFQEKGIFPESEFVRNQILQYLKLLLGIAGYAGYAVLKDSGLNTDLEYLNEIFDRISNTLAPNRFENMWLYLIEDRHLKVRDDGSAIIAEWFDFKRYQELINGIYKK